VILQNLVKTKELDGFRARILKINNNSKHEVSIKLPDGNSKDSLIKEDNIIKKIQYRA